MKFLRAFLCVLCVSVAPAFAATNNAVDASFTAVSNAVAISSPGDIVAIPAGSAYWSNTLVLPALVSLVGSGTNSTHIYDAITNTVNGNYLKLITVTNAQPGANGASYITDIDFESAGVPYNGNESPRLSIAPVNGATLTTLPTNSSVVIQRCIFNRLNNINIQFWGGCNGLVRDCSFILRSTGVKVYGWGNNGEVSYALAPNYGSTNLVCVENCYFTNALGYNSSSAACMDVYNGSRTVFRNNYVVEDFWSNHGLDSGQASRSGRQAEVYNNTFFSVGGSVAYNYPVNFRGGSGVVYSNAVIGYASPANGHTAFKVLQADYFRSAYNNTPYRGANGFGLADSNGAVALTWTVTNTSPLNKIVQANPANWTVNQWVGYTVYCTNNGVYSSVTSNTVDTLWCVAAKDTSTAGNMQDLISTNGQTFTLRQVLPADMEGLGSGDYVNAVNNLYVTNVTTGGTNGWIHQVSEPVYVWGNTLDGVANNYVATYPVIRMGVDIITNGTAKPGYTALVYPHPLAGTNSGGGGTNGGGFVAGQKISQFSPAQAVADGDLMPLVQATSSGYTNRNTTLAQLKNYFTNGTAGGGAANLVAASIARTVAGNGHLYVFMTGDSTTSGYGGGGAGGTNALTNSFTFQLKNLSANANTESFMGSHSGNTDATQEDRRLTMGAGWFFASQPYMAPFSPGNFFANTTTTNAVTFTTTQPADSVLIPLGCIYLAGNMFVATNDVICFATNSSLGGSYFDMPVVEIPLPPVASGTKITIWKTNATSQLFFHGLIFQKTNSVSFVNCGSEGADAVGITWGLNAGTNLMARLGYSNCINVVSIGINAAGRATFGAELANYWSLFLPFGALGVQMSMTPTYSANLATNAATIKAIASQLNLPFIDAWSYFGTYPYTGWGSSPWSYDGQHLTAAGYGEVSKIIANGLGLPTFLPNVSTTPPTNTATASGGSSRSITTAFAGSSGAAGSFPNAAAGVNYWMANGGWANSDNRIAMGEVDCPAGTYTNFHGNFPYPGVASGVTNYFMIFTNGVLAMKAQLIGPAGGGPSYAPWSNTVDSFTLTAQTRIAIGCTNTSAGAINSPYWNWSCDVIRTNL